MEMAIIREIQLGDNAKVAKLIREVLEGLGVPKVGTAYADSVLDSLFDHYNVSRADYFVVEEGNRILGCAGIGPLQGEDDKICELQKMYFLPEARGRGLGYKMMKVCLDRAKSYGYEECYLETMPNMLEAQKLYVKWGFEYIDSRMGETGHFSCPVWMLKSPI